MIGQEIAVPEGSAAGNILSRWLLIVVAALALASAGRAQQWWNADPGFGLAVEDAAAGVIRYVGGGTEWDGQGLRYRPGGRDGLGTLPMQAAAFDPVRRRFVAFMLPIFFGGLEGIYEWDGGSWIRVAGPLLPSFTSGGSAVYDVREQVVAFVVNAREIYAWDGAALTSHPAANQLGGTWFGSPIYDQARGRLVFVRSSNLTVYEWDGAQWHTIVPATRPPASSLAAYCYDSVRQTSLMSLGETNGGSSDVWSWDGSDWSLVTVAPFHRSYHKIAVDRNGDLIVAGGLNEFPRDGVATDGWRFDGQSWTLAFDEIRPRRANWAAYGADPQRGRFVRHGGSTGTEWLDETWEWDGVEWSKIASVGGPGARRYMTSAYDTSLGQLCFFGGRDRPGAFYDDLWAWDGTSWTALPAAVSPSPRRVGRMAYDTVRNRLVLYGGEGPSGPSLTDTWEYDGATWTQVGAVSGPSVRAPYTFAFDPGRSAAVLFGRVQVNQVETWEWDGVAWALRDAATGPDTGPFASAYDPAASSVVLSGLVGNALELFDWDGSSWTVRPGAPGPAWVNSSSLSGLFIDGARARVTHAAGGLNHFAPHAPMTTVVGPSCGTPRLDPIELPIVGKPGFRLELNAVRQPAAGCLFALGLLPGSVPLGSGCALAMATADASVFSITDTNGHAGLDVSIPAVASLAGLHFRVQAFVLDGQSPLGFAASDAREVQVGN